MAFDGLARFCWFRVIEAGFVILGGFWWPALLCMFLEVPGGLGWFLVAFRGFWWPALVSVVSGSSW